MNKPRVKRILFQDEAGNQLVETFQGEIGVRNANKVFIRKSDLRDFLKENKLGRKIRLMGKGKIWISTDFLLRDKGSKK